VEGYIGLKFPYRFDLTDVGEHERLQRPFEPFELPKQFVDLFFIRHAGPPKY
jgi:hypothetical protein